MFLRVALVLGQVLGRVVGRVGRVVGRVDERVVRSSARARGEIPGFSLCFALLLLLPLCCLCVSLGSLEAQGSVLQRSSRKRGLCVCVCFIILLETSLHSRF